MLHAEVAEVSPSNLEERWRELVAGFSTIDRNAQVLSLAWLASAAMAWLAQPLLASVARVQRSPSSALEGQSEAARARRLRV